MQWHQEKYSILPVQNQQLYVHHYCISNLVLMFGHLNPNLKDLSYD